MKKHSFIIMLLILVILMAGCKKKGEDIEEGTDMITPIDNPVITPSNVPTTTPVEESDVGIIAPEGMVQSRLSGLWIPEELENKRPLAIQFSNFKTVSNQWGISQADIVYEAIVEGGITRLLGIGDSFTGDRIGSVRSSRHYFVSVLDEYDAIYVHYGKTKYAVSKLKELGIDNLDGETGIGNTVFYRDKSMKAPHNAFTSGDRIQKGIEQKKFRTDLKENYEAHYKFYQEDTDLVAGSLASRIDIKFSGYNSPYFEYDSTNKVYLRSQFGKAHVDSNTKEQLQFKNIIVQFVKEWAIDKNDYRTMEQADASGTGYYISNGSMIPITWKKKEANKWMRYYDEAGNELTINPGKTYIALFPNGRTKDVIVKE